MTTNTDNSEEIIKIGDCQNCPFLHINHEWESYICNHPANSGNVKIEVITAWFSDNCPASNILIKFKK